MYVSMYVLFCHVLYVLYVYCMHIYTFMYMYIWMCVYICMFICVHISFSLCMCWYTLLFVLNLFNYLSCRYLRCYLSVWHCYLGGILAFSFEIVKLHRTICTRFSTQVIKISLGSQFRNILRLFNVLPNFPFTIIETMGDYYL